MGSSGASQPARSRRGISAYNRAGSQQWCTVNVSSTWNSIKTVQLPNLGQIQINGEGSICIHPCMRSNSQYCAFIVTGDRLCHHHAPHVSVNVSEAVTLSENGISSQADMNRWSGIIEKCNSSAGRMTYPNPQWCKYITLIPPSWWSPRLAGLSALVSKTRCRDFRSWDFFQSGSEKWAHICRKLWPRRPPSYTGRTNFVWNFVRCRDGAPTWMYMRWMVVALISNLETTHRLLGLPVQALQKHMWNDHSQDQENDSRSRVSWYYLLRKTTIGGFLQQLRNGSNSLFGWEISVSTCQWDNMSWIISIYIYRMTLLYVHLAMININERVMGCTDDPQAPSSHRDSYKFTKTHAAMNFKTSIL